MSSSLQEPPAVRGTQPGASVSGSACRPWNCFRTDPGRIRQKQEVTRVPLLLCDAAKKTETLSNNRRKRFTPLFICTRSRSVISSRSTKGSTKSSIIMQMSNIIGCSPSTQPNVLMLPLLWAVQSRALKAVQRAHFCFHRDVLPLSPFAPKKQTFRLQMQLQRDGSRAGRWPEREF